MILIAVLGKDFSFSLNFDFSFVLDFMFVNCNGCLVVDEELARGSYIWGCCHPVVKRVVSDHLCQIIRKTEWGHSISHIGQIRTRMSPKNFSHFIQCDPFVELIIL